MSDPTGATVDVVKTRDYNCCALCGFVIWGVRGLNWSLHHRRPRGAGGTKRAWVNLPANLILLHGSGVTGCHHTVESERYKYYGNGFLIHEGALVAAEVPIEHRIHGLVLLDNEGSYRGVTI